MFLLQSLRKKSGYSQSQFAKLMNVDQTAISQWETGKNTPRADKLPKLAAALNCSIDDLFREDAEDA